MSIRQIIMVLVSLAFAGLVGCSAGSDAADPAEPAIASTAATDSDSGATSSPPLPRLIVGTEIEPGLNIADELGTCFYARLATEEGSPDDALGQANALGAQVFVTIEPTDAALLSLACGEWRLATESDLTPTSDGGIPDDGMWLVPEHISPGTYRTVNGDLDGGCFYQTVSDLSATLEAVLETEQGLSGQPTLTITSEVRAVRAYRCGAWEKVSG